MNSYKEIIISLRHQTFDIDSTTMNTITRLLPMMFIPLLKLSCFGTSLKKVTVDTCVNICESLRNKVRHK
jgi:hypothetical protein